jgi:hypothetical protein
MGSTVQEQRQQAQMLLNALPDDKIPKVRTLLASLVDPLSAALASAPLDDEPLSEEDAHALAEARESLARGEGIPHEEILKEFGLTWEDWDRMGQTPLDAPQPPARR